MQTFYGLKNPFQILINTQLYIWYQVVLRLIIYTQLYVLKYLFLLNIIICLHTDMFASISL